MMTERMILHRIHRPVVNHQHFRHNLLRGIHRLWTCQFNRNNSLIMQMKLMNKLCSLLRTKVLDQKDSHWLSQFLYKWNRDMRHVSHDSDDNPPKAKAKVQMKKQKVQLPGHQYQMVPPTVKPPEEDDESHPAASSSNDPTFPLPTTTPHSFTPSPAVPDDEADYDTPQLLLW